MPQLFGMEDFGDSFEARNSKNLTDFRYELQEYFDQIKNCMK